MTDIGHTPNVQMAAVKLKAVMFCNMPLTCFFVKSCTFGKADFVIYRGLGILYLGFSKLRRCWNSTLSTRDSGWSLSAVYSVSAFVIFVVLGLSLASFLVFVMFLLK